MTPQVDNVYTITYMSINGCVKLRITVGQWQLWCYRMTPPVEKLGGSMFSGVAPTKYWSGISQSSLIHATPAGWDDFIHMMICFSWKSTQVFVLEAPVLVETHTPNPPTVNQGLEHQIYTPAWQVAWCHMFNIQLFLDRSVNQILILIQQSINKNNITF